MKIPGLILINATITQQPLEHSHKIFGKSCVTCTISNNAIISQGELKTKKTWSIFTIQDAGSHNSNIGSIFKLLESVIQTDTSYNSDRNKKNPNCKIKIQNNYISTQNTWQPIPPLFACQYWNQNVTLLWQLQTRSSVCKSRL